MFYLTTHSTHFIYGYMASDIWLRVIQIARGNPLPPHGLLFPISSNCSFICTIPDRITHTTAFVTSRGALAGTRNSSMGPHHGGSDNPSHHDRTLLPRSYISLPHKGFLKAEWVGVRLLHSLTSHERTCCHRQPI